MTLDTAPGRLAAAAAVLATIAAGVGLFVDGFYRDVPFWAQQARATDVATLFLGVPILLAGLWAARRGSSIGQSAVLAGLLYLVYNYAIYSFSVAVNPLLAVYIATLALAVWSIALALHSGAIARSVGDRLPRRTTAGVLVGVAVVFGLLWLSQIASAALTGVVPVDIERAALPTNPIYALDLALFLPLCVVAAVGMYRRAPAAAAFALPMLIWLFLTSVGVVGAFVFAAAAGDAFAVVPGVLVSAIGVLTGGLAVLGMVRGSRERSPHPPADARTLARWNAARANPKQAGQ
jgi:hypothetical protein